MPWVPFVDALSTLAIPSSSVLPRSLDELVAYKIPSAMEHSMQHRWKNYHEYLIENLRDPAEREAYLNTALEGGDPKTLLKALRNVAEAMGGMRKLAARTKLSRESLYRMLSERGNPELRSLGRVLRSFGLSLRVASHHSPAHAP